MPIYQYLCPKCSHKFELRQSFRAENAAPCPRCHNGAQRLFAPVPIIFKGSGFYITDSKKTSSSSSTDTDKGKEAGGTEDKGKEAGSTEDKGKEAGSTEGKGKAEKKET